MLSLLFSVITALLTAATLLPLWRWQHWLIRSFDFPRLQFALTLVAVLILELLLLDWSEVSTQILIGIGFACLLYQIWWIIRYSPLVPKEVRLIHNPEPERCLRILTANVLTPNRNAQALLDLVHTHQPDILVTLESDRWWQRQLNRLQGDYPYSVKCPLDNLFGMHVYSKLKLSSPSIEYLVEEDIPSIHTLVQLRSGHQVRCHFLHPEPPSPTQKQTSSERDAELVIVAKRVAQKDDATIVAGDLNDVAWSETTRLFRKISGLLDPRIGRGMYNTFHAGYWFLRWPLDHLFHSDHFGLTKLERLGHIGSDHFPLLTELAYIGDAGKDQTGITPDSSDHDIANKKEQQQGLGEQTGAE